MRIRYYLPFIPKAQVDYLLLLDLADIAEYNIDTKQFDTIQFQSVSKLAERLNRNNTTLTRHLEKSAYKPFFTYQKNNKRIILHTDFTATGIQQPFVVLTNIEVQIIRYYEAQDKEKTDTKVNANLLCKYLMYLKYYCGYNKTRQTDTTEKQFLEACGYCGNSSSYKALIAKYNEILTRNKIFTIKKYRDELGHLRHRYSLR